MCQHFSSASIPKIPMTILSLIHLEFNRLRNDTYYGPQVIPMWHPLYQKHYWRCGWYRRKLILFDKRVIFVIVFRFYCPETKKTYSLLPFFISRYERHINTVIEDNLKGHFIEGASAEALAEAPSPSPWTIRRWLRKFQSNIDDIRPKVEEFLISNVPIYHPTAAWNRSIRYILSDFLQKAEQLPIPDKNLYLYGSLSYLQYAAAVQQPSL